MIKALKVAIVSVLLPVFAFAGTPAMAAAEGQIEGGGIYYAKNITKGTGFDDPISADKCETVQYRVRIHNPGPGDIQGVTVKATLPSGVSNNASSTATVSSINSDPASVSDTATVNLSGSYKVNYVPGSTQLLGPSAEVLQTLPDTILTSGVSVGRVGVSLGEKRFVQFSAKVNCETTTIDVCPNIPGDQTEVPAGKVQDKDGNCVDKPTVTITEKKTHTPAALPSTGPAEILSGVTGASALGYGVQRYVASRRNRQ